jgi:stage IV sporulation protein A
MRVDKQTRCPDDGQRKTGEELLQYLMDEFENNPGLSGRRTLFRKSLHDWFRKDYPINWCGMPEDVRMRFKERAAYCQRSSGGLICILL